MDDRLIEVIAYLRKHQKRICNGSYKLTLTASLLHKINLAVEEYTINDDTISFEDFNGLSDIISKVPKLVITQRMKLEKWSLDVSKFEKLQYIEIYNIPINSVAGIKPLKHQLRVLVCHNVSTSIVDIIGYSDLWEELHTAKLCYNGFEFFIQSYNTPWLQYLDLSHNKLKGEIKLQSMTNLKYLNLKFNCLDSFPVLGEEGYRSLKVLLLSNNFLQNLSVVPMFNALEELDVSYNILTDHSELRAIVFLSNLKNLNLSNNPISYHPFHRLYTCQNINKTVNCNVFLLDGRLLNCLEIKMISNFHENTDKNFSFPHLKSHLPSDSIGYNLFQPNTEIKTVCSKSISATIPDSRENCFPIVPVTDIFETGGNGIQKMSETNLCSYDCYFSEKLRFFDHSTNSSTSTKQPASTVDIGFIKSIGPLDMIVDNYSSSAVAIKPVYSQKLISNLAKENMLIHDEVKFLYIKNQDRLYEDLLAAGIRPTHLTSNFDLHSQSNDENNQNYSFINITGEIIKTDSENESTSSDDSFAKLLLAKRKLPNGRYLDVIVALDESFIREISIMDGSTLFSWSLKSILSCEYLSFNPTSVCLVFNKTLRDFRDRIYVLDSYLDAEKLMKNIRLFLETRSLSSMNQNVYRCLKCNSVFSQELQKNVLFPENVCKTDAFKHKSKVKCYTCDSSLVIVEEDISFSKKDPVNQIFPVLDLSPPVNSKFKTQAVSFFENPIMEHEIKGGNEVFEVPESLFTECDSDIEVITNPSQSSIDVQIPSSNAYVMSDNENYYSILGCEENATTEVIKKCYHEKALTCHPDKGSVTKCVASFDKIHKAWKTLSDPVERQVYDANLSQQRLSQHNLVFGRFRLEELSIRTTNEYFKVCRCGGEFIVYQEDVRSSHDSDLAVECDSCSLVIIISD